MAATALPITDDHFTAEVLESDVPVIVDFWAPWCAPCRMMSPILEELAGERDDLRVVKVDIDVSQDAAARYGVLAAPTLIVLKDGAPVLTLVGSRPKARLVKEIAAVI